jgi:hypothetical protein
VNQYKNYTKEDWVELDGIDWAWLLREQPQFSIHCDWEKLDWLDWCWLLKAQPRFSIHCNLEKISGLNLRWLLITQPHLRPIGECFT